MGQIIIISESPLAPISIVSSISTILTVIHCGFSKQLTLHIQIRVGKYTGLKLEVGERPRRYCHRENKIPRYCRSNMVPPNTSSYDATTTQKTCWAIPEILFRDTYRKKVSRYSILSLYLIVRTINLISCFCYCRLCCVSAIIHATTVACVLYATLIMLHFTRSLRYRIYY